MVDEEGGPQYSAVLLLAGGGIDSTACLQQLRHQNFDVRLVHVNFGQAAAKEEWAAVTRVASFFNAEATQISVAGPETFQGGEIVGRNAFLIFTALVFLRPVEKLICIGVHSGTPFFDCSQAFLDDVSPLVASITDGRARLIAPLSHLQKADVISYCREQKLPIQITYSCQTGTAVPCGKCMSCLDRKAMGC